MLIGDLIERALTTIGVTKERVYAIWGDCNCSERKEFYNTLHRWARMCVFSVATGRMSLEDAKRHYETLMEDFENVVKEVRQAKQRK